MSFVTSKTKKKYFGDCFVGILKDEQILVMPVSDLHFFGGTHWGFYAFRL